LYEAAIRKHNILHLEFHEYTYPGSIEELRFAEDERPTYSDGTESTVSQLATWHIPRLQHLSFIRCGVWCDDASNHSANARQLAALLARARAEPSQRGSRLLFPLL
jgi:hypothetical protein